MTRWHSLRPTHKPVSLIRAGIALLVIPAFGCSSSTELETLQAQVEDLQVQVLQLRKSTPNKEELEALETSLDNHFQSLIESSRQVTGGLTELQDRILGLEEKLEETNFELIQLNQKIVATNQELQAMRSTNDVLRRQAPPPPAVDPGPTDPRVLYDTALEQYFQAQDDPTLFARALKGFQQYITDYPDTELADNATYWIGECYFGQGKFQKAVEYFDRVLTRFESSDRTPSALLRKGHAFLELGQPAQGIVQLQEVSCEHAGTDEAHLARQRLEEMGIDAEC